MSSKLEFSYWSDPLCIWAFVAQDKLDRILEAQGCNLTVHYRIVPVFGSLPWRFRDGPWAETGPEGRVTATHRVAADHGHADVSGQVWTQDPPASSWSPSVAIKAVTRLETEGALPPGSTASYLWRLRQKFFLENCNIARRQHQQATAEELDIPWGPVQDLMDEGLAEADLWEDYQEKERLGLRGSPSYVFDGGRAVLYGNFPFGILRATIEELLKGLILGGTQC